MSVNDRRTPTTSDDGDGDGDRDGDGDGDGDGDSENRAPGVGVAGFIAVHLLALLVLGDPSFLELAGVEAVAVGLLLAGDAVATGLRTALPTAAGVLAALCAVGGALGPLELSTWLVTVGLLVVWGTTLYAEHCYDRSVAGGEPA